MADVVTGGTWTSNNTNAIIGSSTGLVTGNTVGTSIITYSMGGSCRVTHVVTVTNGPAAIAGAAGVCVGSSVTLTDATAGGTWSSSSTGVATVVSTSGVVTGVSAGTSVVTYLLTATGCYTTTLVTVYATPGPITGTTTVCLGGTTLLGDITAGGTWISSSTAHLTVGSTTGVVTGVALGTAVVTYSLGGVCNALTTVTIVPNPAAITGTTTVCAGSTTSLSDGTAGGAWSSSTTAVATVGSTGVVAGISGGTSVITYHMPTGCIATATVTVNPSPTPITGLMTLCSGTCTPLTDGVGGGTWSSSNTSVATAGTGGSVCGVSAGSSTVTYQLGTGCEQRATVTVYTMPTAITGPTALCTGTCAPLGDGVSGGTWASSSTATATIGSGTGLLCGISLGTAVITYTVAGFCSVSETVTISAGPTPISGPAGVCVGAAVPYTDGVSGGIWSSAGSNITVNSTTGIVTGVTAGTALLTYSLGTGCTVTASITITPAPMAITGAGALCSGATLALSDGTGGGAWTSGSTSTATVGTTGIVTGGVTAGTATITYTAGGCTAITTVTVNPTPGPIGGPASVCAGQSITATDGTPGGSWSSSNANATVNSTTGLVTGVTAGTSIISYSFSGGCQAITTVTIWASPGAITGPVSVCTGQTITQSDGTGIGSWSSSSTGTATINSTTGLVTGIIPGTTAIIYTLPGGCTATDTVTVNQTPAAIGGPATVCAGQSITQTDATAGGAWGSSNTAVASIGSTGSLLGVGGGTATITYSLSGCAATRTVTVYTAPSAIGGPLALCNLHCITLTDAVGGGTWVSGTTSVATITGAGLLCATAIGSTIVTYTVPGGCATTTTINVTATPTPISGPATVCSNAAVLYTDGITGGLWSSSNTAVATAGSLSGVVSGVSAGSATITYSLGTGCIQTATVTVLGAPAITGGATAICVGLSATWAGSGGGLWSSSNTSVATIGSLSGTVNGISSGTALVTYAVSNGCYATGTITVNSLPGPITGTLTLCQYASALLSDPTPGGTWASSNTAIAVIGSTGGMLSGVAAGTAAITYTEGIGCYTTTVVTINLSPGGITGLASVCVGQTTTLGDPVIGGTWSSSGVYASIVTGGIVTGVAAGTEMITYTLSTGCSTTRPVTVYASPGAISGALGVCTTQTTILTDLPGGGAWSISSGIATIGSTTGIVNAGTTAGTATVSYTLSGSCTATAALTVNPTPGPISAPPVICAGNTLTLTDGTSGGSWTSGNTAVATIAGIGGTGIVSGVSGGSSIISYTLPAGCYTTRAVTINTTPAPVTGSANMCRGTLTTWSDTPFGGTWSSSNTAVAPVNMSTGQINGLSTGTAVITYALATGCEATKTITVNPTATPIISGPVCTGTCTTLTDGTAGGSWTSSATTVATIDTFSGMICGVMAGTTGITYSLGAGCTATSTITVNISPTIITGATTLCVGQAATLADGTAGGAWSSSNTAVATIGSASALLTGRSGGSATITYAMPSGCTAVTPATVYPLAVISGSGNICQGSTETLTASIGGGTFSSTDPAVTVSAGGTVLGISPGPATITYTLPTGCYSTASLNVNPIPGAISGTLSVCVNQSATLSGTGGGTWSSSTGAASIVSTTGLLTGITAGTSLISYTLGTGCASTATAIVNPLPNPIASTAASACLGGACPILSDGTHGGSWSSSSPGIASITVGGTLSCVSPGAAAISYTLPTGCQATTTITINPLPLPVTGSASICVGQTTTLADGTGGGTWSSSNPAVGSIDPLSGLVAGLSAGTATMTWTLPTGCYSTLPFTVYGTPTAIIGLGSLCTGASTTFSDGVSGGLWTSGNPLVATITGTGSTGTVTGISSGTVLMFYTLGTGCQSIKSIIINPVSPIDGPPSVCVGQSIILSDTTAGGVWASGSAAATAAGITDTTAVITGITAGAGITISYTLSTGCTASKTISVNPPPGPIFGTMTLCQGQTTNLRDFSGGGTWGSLNTAVATISTGGLVSGITAGTSTIVYTSGGCTRDTTVTVYPVPTPISGAPQVCLGQTQTLSDGTSGGVWTSSRTGIATVGSSSGIVTGLSAGTTAISYTLGTGCAVSALFTVNPLPAAVTGQPLICIGGTTTYSDATVGGTWQSSAFWIASVGALSGVITGGAIGTAMITYQVSTGCIATKAVTVTTMPPAITGPTQVCLGGTATLSDAGGTSAWLSSNTGVATIGSSTGVVTGAGAGTAIIIFTLGGGCTTTANITVNPLPGAISGPGQLCSSTVLSTITGNYSDPTAGGTWSSSNPTVASIDSLAGVLTTGTTAGIITISYLLPTGCYSTMSVEVFPTPDSIKGTMTQCLGSRYTLTDSIPGGVWSSSAPAVLGINPVSGLDTAKALGTVTIIYVIGPGCTAVTSATVVPLPLLYNMTMAGTGHYCNGGAGVQLGLSGSNTGINYLLYRGSTATGTFPGTGSALNFGLQTVAGVYHVEATSTYTDCTVAMLGADTIVIDPNVTPSVGITPSPGDTVCAGTAVTFTATPTYGGAPTYIWNVNGVNVSAGNTYTFVPANGDQVKVTMTSNYHCVLPDTASHSVTMDVQNQAFPQVTFTADPGDTVCQGIAVNFTATPAFGGSAPTYTWTINSTVMGYGPTFGYIPVNHDTVQCLMSSNFPCRLADTGKSNKMVMAVDAPIIPHVTITAYPGYQVGPADTVTLTAVVTNGSSPTYQWYINSVPVPGATNATFSRSGYDSTFEDSVSVVVTNEGICPMASHNWIYIRVSSLGVDPMNLAGSDIRIQPNPNKGEFTVTGTTGSQGSDELVLEITDVLGRKVYSGRLKVHNGIISEHITLGSNIAPGMYLLNLRSDTGNRIFHMVVEE